MATLDALSGILQFASVAYLVVLALTVAVYFLLPGVRSRVAWLLFASVGFYLLIAPRALIVLLGVVAITYAFGRLIGRAQGGRRRSTFTVGIVLVLGALALFKYANALLPGLTAMFDGPAGGSTLGTLRIALPLGMSFWTFQAVAYLTDVYRAATPAIENPALLGLSMMYFPVVTAGPITRIQALVPQLSAHHRFDLDRAQSGLLLIGRGFFKKLMVADRLGVLVASVFDDPHRFGDRGGPLFLLAAVSFSVQIYCDFSGYTDIVRGSARLFGVELPQNFREPYFARSIREFWRRWHVSLMDWLREYVYIPLGGNRKGRLRQYVNLMAVFLVSGLWHGTGLTFVVWGGLNGMYSVVGGILQPLRTRILAALRVPDNSRLLHAARIAVTFGLITVAWVFFRAGSLSDAFYIVTQMLVPGRSPVADGALLSLGLSKADLAIALLATAVVWIADALGQRRDLLAVFRRQSLAVRWLAYFVLVGCVLVFGYYGAGYNAADFIYFKF